MKKDRINRVIGGIDDDIVEMAENKSKVNQKRITWVKWGSIAAAFVLVLSATFIVPGMLSRNNIGGDTNSWPTKHVPLTQDEVAGPITADTWAATGNAGKYMTLNYSNTEYSTCAVVLDESNKGSSLGEAIVTGQDPFSLEMHEMAVEVYAINGIDPQIAVAVKFSEPDNSVNGLKHVYAYMNTGYYPTTLGDFIRDLDFDNKLEIGLCYMYQEGKYTIVFENLTKAKLMEFLTSCASVENVQEPTTGRDVMSISASLLGMNKSITLTEDGYLMSNIFETGKWFYIGQDKVNEFVKYVTDNCDGYVYVYDEPDGEVAE